MSWLDKLKLFIKKLIPDKLYLKIMFKKELGYKLNLSNPRTFNEKMQWLKLYDRKAVYTTMVDKYEVKKYVSSIIGNQYIIPTIGVWKSFGDIDFSLLPNQFVLKCTHDSGGLVICKDKEGMDFQKAKEKIESSLKRNYYWNFREWPYKNVTPRIIAEKYMFDSVSDEIADYKYMCFNGNVRAIFLCTERYSSLGMKLTVFDRDWKRMPFGRHYPSIEAEIPRPHNFYKMIELAEKLSRDISFLRVDFYEIDKKIYFGELTFYPGAGFERFIPSEWDEKLGEWICLPSKS